MIRTLLIGAGRAGHFHAANLNRSDRFEPVCVADLAEEKASALAETLGCPYALDAEEALDQYRPDAVIVASTTYTHAALTLAALKHGAHVLCEKPLGGMEDIRACYAAARQAGRTLLVAFNRRFDPEYRELRRQLNGAVPQIAKITSRDSPIPSKAYLAQSGGIVSDCAVHDIDMSNWMMGGADGYAVPVEAYATGYTHHPDLKAWGEVEGMALTMRYADGRLALIDASRTCVFGYDQRAELFGTFGMLQMRNRLESTVASFGKDGAALSKPLYSFPERYADSYRLELEHFADAAEGKAPCEIEEAHVLACEAAVKAAERSLESGKPEPVSL